MYKISKLPNQLEVISVPMSGAKTVTALVMAATGSKFENAGLSGISHFLEHMFFKGTVKRPSTLAISSELDKAGGEYNAFTGKEYTGYYVKVEAKALPLALEVVSDMLLNSKFAAREIEREKAVVAEELNMYLDNPLLYIEDLFEQCLYGDTPAGRDTIGDKQSIAKFSRASVLDYFKRQYSSDQAIICLAGKVGPDAVKLADKYFGKFAKKNYQDKVKTDDRQTEPRLKLNFKKTDQAHLSLGVRGLPFAHPDELAVKLCAMILGGSMSSRLFIELRERRGLAYYVRTHDEPYTDCGYLTTQAGVPVGELAQSVKIILSQYKKIARDSAPAAELARVKQSLIGRTALHLETSDAAANWYARQAIMLKEQKSGEKILTPDEYYAAVKKVSAADVRRVARKIFAENNLNLAVIGPYEDEGELEKMLSL